VEPLLKDFIDKEFITGTTLAKISLSMTGDTPDEIKQTLGGNGDLQFNDGAIRNINLLDMIQNIQAAFGSGDGSQTEETRFSEFKSLFTITNGVVNTGSTTVSSPVLRVDVTGSADLVKESLDFRVNPAYINPKNQKESGMSISGNQVPVLVTGTFTEPKFKPDLETAAKKVVTEKLTEKLGDVLGGSESGTSEDGEETIEDSVKGLLKNLPFGR
jgi:AsmA protein